MNKGITDYNVRVWDEDLFIKGKNINLWLGCIAGGLQCNYEEDSDEYEEILALCKAIKVKFMRLNELTNKKSE